jgi:hypothetical protein
VSDEYLDAEGNFDRGLLPDCNLFDVRSIAAVCGFRDRAYFRDIVLPHPDCPIHVHRIVLRDQKTGNRVEVVYATHQNSADFGGQMWREMTTNAARERAANTPTLVNSGDLMADLQFTQTR